MEKDIKFLFGDRLSNTVKFSSMFLYYLIGNKKNKKKEKR